MHSLELKIPPPVVALIFGICMWFIASLAPSFALPFKSRVVFAVLLALVGQAVGVAGMIAFRRAKTTLNPVNPSMVSSLVAGGIFRYTRNPMYLGWSLTLLGLAGYLASPVTLLFVPLFMLYITRFQIKPEERALSSMFGAQYVAYSRAVRRWL